MKHTYRVLRDEVNQLAKGRSVKDNRAFATYSLQVAHDLDEDDAFEQTDTLRGSGGGDGSLDGWFADPEQHEFHIWQCKYSKGPKKYDAGPGMELLSALHDLLDEDAAAKKGEPFVRASQRALRAQDAGNSFVLHLGLAGSLRPGSRANLEDALKRASKKLGLAAQWDIWDLNRFQVSYDEDHRGAATLKGVKVAFPVRTRAVAVRASELGLPRGWSVAVATVDGAALGKIAMQYGVRLYDLNVRYGLGSNSRIRAIRDTLANEKSARYFWLYNNGLTIICDKISPAETQLTVTNPQVVNGCQTVNAFRLMHGKYDNVPCVLARFIQPPTDADGKKQAGLIAKYTNSQTPILTSDLRSNDSVQSQIQERFKKLDWFYERKRGEWATLKPSQKRHYRKPPAWMGGDRRFDWTYLGQAWRMLDGQPAEALTRKREMFEKDDVYDDIFNPGRDTLLYQLAVELRRYFDMFWRGQNAKEIAQAWGDDFTDDTLNRLMRAKGQIVAHSVALSGFAIRGKQRWSNVNLESAIANARALESGKSIWLTALSFAFRNRLAHVDQAKTVAGLKRYLESSEQAALNAMRTDVSSFARASKFDLAEMFAES